MPTRHIKCVFPIFVAYFFEMAFKERVFTRVRLVKGKFDERKLK